MSIITPKIRTTVLLLMTLAVQSCASGGDTVSAAACTQPPRTTDDYRIGSGDTLQVVVWRNDELSTTVPVRPDGKITTPLIDDLVASGKTPSQLSGEMEQVLSEYLRTPEVSVIVIGQGAANQIQVVGEVVNPQPMSYREGLRVLDLIVTVGGLTDFAAGNRSNLVRELPTGSIECRVKVKDLLSGDMSQNIEVFAGDVLVIPETRF